MSPTDTPRLRLHDFKKVLEHPFGVAGVTTTATHGVLVEFEGAWGEAAPTKMYNESVKSVMEVLSKPLPPLPDATEDPGPYIDELAAGELGAHRSALAAVDNMLYDRWGRAKGKPVWRLLGADPSKLAISSFTIGIDDLEVMLDKVQTVGERSPILKIKLGRHPERDAETMRAIRRAGPDKTLRVDANQGWTEEQALRLIPVMAELGVEFVEQPLRRNHVPGMKRLKPLSALPIYLDENCHLADTVPELADMGHGVNVKLAKSGGIREALRIVKTAREHGLGLMLGCMVETSVGITAAAQIAPFFDCVDLDGHVLTGNDPFIGCGWDQGRLHLSNEPGFGLRLREGVTL